MLENITSQATNNNTVWRINSANWKTKAANTHSEYVILIAFLQHQLLEDRSQMLHFYRGADKFLARQLPNVFCLMVKIFRLMLVLLYIQGVSRL
jgi:hypothetical protein